MKHVDLLKVVMINDAEEIERIVWNNNYILSEHALFCDLLVMHRRDLAMIGVYLEDKDYLLEDNRYNDGLVTLYEILGKINKEKATDLAIFILYATILSENQDLKTIFLELIKY